MTNDKGQSTKEKGYTLLEILIATTIFAILLSMVYQLLASSQASYDASTGRSEMQVKARRILDDMVKELRLSGASACILLSSSSIQFSKNVGYTSPSITWGDQTTYTLQYDTDDTNNGVDDNKNGYTDEQIITKQAGGVTTVIARNIKEGGLTFAIESTNLVVIQLTVLGKNEKGEVVETSVDTKVFLRN